MSILFHEIQLDRPCGWHGKRWTKVSLHHLVPEGAEDLLENRQYVPSHEAVELLSSIVPPTTETDVS